MFSKEQCIIKQGILYGYLVLQIISQIDEIYYDDDKDCCQYELTVCTYVCDYIDVVMN